VDEDAEVTIVLCSDGPENAHRLRLQGLGNDIVMVDEAGETHFRWDGTYDEHGDACYRQIGKQHLP
jgi:hypothetical protein